MQSLANINFASLLDTLVSIGVAFVLGTLIGLERQIRQRTAGLRTNTLVCVGAALFVDIAVRFHEIHGGTPTALHVIAYVVSGVGFLGAGVIMREGGTIRGLNTAATLWGSAAVGSAAGADLLLEAILGAAFVLGANTLLRPIVNAINRQPLDTPAVEVTNTVYVIARREHRKSALELLEAELERSGYPAGELAVHAFGQDDVEIEATLAATSVEGEELDALVARLAASPLVNQAFWSPSTTE